VPAKEQGEDRHLVRKLVNRVSGDAAGARTKRSPRPGCVATCGSLSVSGRVDGFRDIIFIVLESALALFSELQLNYREQGRGTRFCTKGGTRFCCRSSMLMAAR